nr:hypothetical protein [Tanacetum cinerariifolium]
VMMTTVCLPCLVHRVPRLGKAATLREIEIQCGKYLRMAIVIFAAIIGNELSSGGMCKTICDFCLVGRSFREAEEGLGRKRFDLRSLCSTSGRSSGKLHNPAIFRFIAIPQVVTIAYLALCYNHNDNYHCKLSIITLSHYSSMKTVII